MLANHVEVVHVQEIYQTLLAMQFHLQSIKNDFYLHLQGYIHQILLRIRKDTQESAPALQGRLRNGNHPYRDIALLKRKQGS